jgi:hypothetical protein
MIPKDEVMASIDGLDKWFDHDFRIVKIKQAFLEREEELEVYQRAFINYIKRQVGNSVLHSTKEVKVSEDLFEVEINQTRAEIKKEKEELK